MQVTELFYIAMATLAVMVILQITTFVVARVLYPPEPKIVYREVPVQMVAPRPQVAQPLPQNGPTFTQPEQEVKLPEYEPRKPSSDSLRVDPELPAGLQETRPPGT